MKAELVKKCESSGILTIGFFVLLFTLALPELKVFPDTLGIFVTQHISKNIYTVLVVLLLISEAIVARSLIKLRKTLFSGIELSKSQKFLFTYWPFDNRINERFSESKYIEIDDYRRLTFRRYILVLAFAFSCRIVNLLLIVE